MSEHDEQKALFEWAAWACGRYPELEYLHAIPNGGHRHIRVAKRLKAEGVKPGVPDLCLPVARDGYHGLYIEMKFGRNKPTDHQERWLEFLNEQGYLAVVCWGWEQARETIEEYLDEEEANNGSVCCNLS